MNAQDDLARLTWRSRRGLLELDFWLGDFVRRESCLLSPAYRKQYEKLLECSDPELLDMLQGRVEPPPEMAKLILRIQQTDTIHHD
ncbi:MAG: succinate dehydrogenase assembly factor 2 [Thiobacillaceae bacterium]|jgi:antitoxin CptB